MDPFSWIASWCIWGHHPKPQPAAVTPSATLEYRPRPENKILLTFTESDQLLEEGRIFKFNAKGCGDAGARADFFRDNTLSHEALSYLRVSSTFGSVYQGNDDSHFVAEILLECAQRPSPLTFSLNLTHSPYASRVDPARVRLVNLRAMTYTTTIRSKRSWRPDDVTTKQYTYFRAIKE